MNNQKYIFFGSSSFSTFVLDELKRLQLLPCLIVTTPDKPQGRKLELKPNVVKTWAIENNVPVIDPAKLNSEIVEKIKYHCETNACEVFLVASYGKIIPKAVIDIPKKNVLNIHPSLLPKYRGPSPLPSAMLNDDKKTGVTIMRIDEEMDHGPIVATKSIEISKWPIYEEFEKMMAESGAKLFAQILPAWMAGGIAEVEQNHNEASYTKKIEKEDSLINLDDDPYKNFLKIQAFHEWPQAYFIFNYQGKDIRVKVTQAQFIDNQLIIEKVIPEGKREMSYSDFLRGYAK